MEEVKNTKLIGIGNEGIKKLQEFSSQKRKQDTVCLGKIHKKTTDTIVKHDIITHCFHQVSMS